MNHMMDDPAERVGYLLWQGAHVVGRAIASALAPFDLTAAQFGLIVHTSREPGVSAAELARRLNLTPQSVQTALRPLLDRGVLERRAHPVHGRVLGNFLTAQGRVLAEEANEAVVLGDQELIAVLTKEQQRAIHDGLRAIVLRLNPAALDRASVWGR